MELGGGSTSGSRNTRQTEQRPVGGGGDNGVQRRGLGAVGREMLRARKKSQAVERQAPMARKKAQAAGKETQR